MAQKGRELNSEKFSCSICLDLLKDPMTTPCGHSYCKTCIKARWDGEDQKGVYSCPQCRKAFKLRPSLVKNVMLAELVEELRPPPQTAAAGPEDVAYDVCRKRKMKAVKSCLVCLASYCENHFQPHYESPPLKKHKLAEPSKRLQESVCSRHNKVMDIYCLTDRQSICYLCSVEEHKGHVTVSAAAERNERQTELEVSQRNIQQRIHDQEKDVKLLQQELEAINGSADKAVKDNEKMFRELILVIQTKSSAVKQQIRSQQETEVSRVKELQKKLKMEITKMKRKDTKMKQLLDMEDHNQFLHSYPSVSALSESTHSSSINLRPQIRFEKVTAAVKQFTQEVLNILRDKWTNMLLARTQSVVLPPQPEPEPEPEPKTRDGFLKYSRDITLDPNTANKQLMLSDGDRKATTVTQPQSYPKHPDRFTGCRQVLSRESLTGRCYWEVELGGLGLYVAVSYKNISRAASECSFESNKKSWALHVSKDSYTFWHKNTKTVLSRPFSSRIGVYLDHSAGVLSFYSVSETMTLLHRVQTTFTEPLHAGLYLVCYGSSAEFIQLR